MSDKIQPQCAECSVKYRVCESGNNGKGPAFCPTRNYKSVIEKALELEGFAADEDKGSVMVGFARNTVLSVADKIIEAVKNRDPWFGYDEFGDVPIEIIS